MRSNILGFSTLAMAAGALGCQIGGSAGLTGTTSPHEPPPPPPPGPAEPVEAGGGVAAGGAGGGVGASPDCPNPANHCLPDGLYLISDRDPDRTWLYMDPAKPQTDVDGGGEATFFNLRTTKDQSTKWHYATRPAGPDDLEVGQRVFMIHQRDGKVYRPPQTRQEATSTKWWTARISSLAPTQTNGYVIITGGYKIDVNALRVSDQVEPAGVQVDLVSGEDPHFLTANHYFVSDRRLKGKWMYVDVAAPIKQPSAATKGDGQFMSLRSGNVSWSKNNWRTRPATKADLQVGKQVFMIHQRDGKVYRAPKDRVEALTTKWFTARVTDNSQLYKGMVTVGGGYLVSVDALRVAR